ncbi:MAG: hypothetical protein Tsb002_21690 [Wenzhouxiangellaceae bacterium]
MLNLKIRIFAIALLSYLSLTACAPFGTTAQHYQPGAELKDDEAIVIMGVHNIADPVYLQLSSEQGRHLTPAFTHDSPYRQFILPAGQYQLSQMYLNRVPFSVPACQCLEAVSFEIIPGQINYVGELRFNDLDMQYFSDAHNFVQQIGADMQGQFQQMIMAHPGGDHAEITLQPLDFEAPVYTYTTTRNWIYNSEPGHPY